MNDAIPLSLREVWDWKGKAEQVTAGMSGPELIEFYKRQADEVQRLLGLDLPSHPAGAELEVRHRKDPRR
jgi:hypothetical protein